VANLSENVAETMRRITNKTGRNSHLLRCRSRAPKRLRRADIKLQRCFVSESIQFPRRYGNGRTNVSQLRHYSTST